MSFNTIHKSVGVFGFEHDPSINIGPLFQYFRGPTTTGGFRSWAMFERKNNNRQYRLEIGIEWLEMRRLLQAIPASIRVDKKTFQEYVQSWRWPVATLYRVGRNTGRENELLNAATLRVEIEEIFETIWQPQISGVNSLSRYSDCLLSDEGLFNWYTCSSYLLRTAELAVLSSRNVYDRGACESVVNKYSKLLINEGLSQLDATTFFARVSEAVSNLNRE